MNLALDERYQAIFLSRGELTGHWLYSLTRDIIRASRDVVFIDFGTTYWLPLPVFYNVDVGDKVVLSPSYLTGGRGPFSGYFPYVLPRF